jgi:pilus assembly protein Flp/PilA
MFVNLLKDFIREQEGQDAIEYALLAGFVSLAIVSLISSLGDGLKTVYTNLGTQVGNIPTGG